MNAVPWDRVHVAKRGELTQCMLLHSLTSTSSLVTGYSFDVSHEAQTPSMSGGSDHLPNNQLDKGQLSCTYNVHEAWSILINRPVSVQPCPIQLQTILLLEPLQAVLEQHCNGHWPDAARHRSDESCLL
jgi:hypothetical protein